MADRPRSAARAQGALVSLAVLCACGTPAERPADPAPAATAAPVGVAAPVTPPEPPAAVLAGGPRHVTLSAAGDLVPNALAMHSIRRAATEAEGYRAFLGGYAASIREDEIAYVNLEVPLVDDVVPLDGGWPRSLTSRPRRAPVLGATPVLAEVLASIGVDVVGLANNHAFDQGHAGLRRTIEAAAGAGLVVVGASERPEDARGPVFVERGGVRVAYVAFTTALNRTGEDEPRAYVGRDRPEEDLLATLRAAADASDVVVVLVHWSTDFVMEATSEVRALARRLVDAGADVVFGSGPHVLQEVARLASPRGEALVAYSLGNVASGMGRAYRVGHPPHDYIHPANVRPEARDGLVLRVAVAISDTAVTIERVEGAALWTENDYVRVEMDATIRTVPLAEASPEVCRERLAAITAAVGPEVVLETACPN